MTQEINNLEYVPLMATDIDCFNAVVNAINCRTFEIYCQYHKEDFKNIFSKVRYQGKELSKSFGTLTIAEFKEVFEKVVAHRNKEIIGEKEVEETPFTELSEYQQIVVKSIYHYGDKLGGIAGIERMAPTELINWFKWLMACQVEESNNVNERLEKLTNKD